MEHLALNTEGELTNCDADEKHIGKGRCNHLLHQKETESNEDFMKRANQPIGMLIDIERESKEGIKSPDDSNIKMPIIPVDNDVVNLNSLHDFGQEKLTGVQLKGFVRIIENGKPTPKFLKLDNLNPEARVHYTDSSWSVLKASVGESITSNFMNYIAGNNENVQSSSSTFVKVQTNEGETSGLLSNNFVQDGQEERILSTKEAESDKEIISHDEFVENIIDNHDNQSVLNNMVNYFNQAGVDKEEAKQFIMNQYVLDLITMNNDRRENAANFIVLQDHRTNESHPLNHDYGRCLTNVWNDKFETAYKNGKFPNGIEVDDEIKQEDLQTGIEEASEGQIGLFLSTPNFNDTVKFLKDNGYQPLKMNLKDIEEDVNFEAKRIGDVNPEVREFAKVKANILLERLKDPRFKDLLEMG